MFIELLDGLRCTADHPQIPLVTAITTRHERFVVEGVVGCPTCRKEYAVHDGIALFGLLGAADAAPLDIAPEDEAGAMRIGALLAVSDGITIALVGDWAAHARALAEITGLRAFAVNPRVVIAESERVGVVHSDNRLPFADGSLRGVAIDESGWSLREMSLAVRALSPGGRMVAPALSAVPDEIEEIARDADVWVGEKRGALVTLYRG
ncbi:MAG: hypothetical protein ABI229_06100 [Gemmatimonadaceae bacterium]